MSTTTKPGKAATKGQKQIFQENVDTVKFYTIMSAVASLTFTAAMLFVFPEAFTWHYWVWLVVSGGSQLVCLYLMRLMATPVFSSVGTLLDGGTDLNMSGGFSEHLKDIIICSSVVQVLILISGWMALLWLFVPFRAVYLFWVNVAAPWFFQQPSEEETAADEKKRKKLDRQMRRRQ